MEHTLAGIHRAKQGVFLASVKEAKVLLAEMHSNGSLAVLAPINVNEKGTEISVLVQDRSGPQGRCVKDGGTKQIVPSLSKQYTRTGTALLSGGIF